MVFFKIATMGVLTFLSIAAHAESAIVESDKYRLYSKPHEMSVTITTSDPGDRAVFTVYSFNKDSLAIQTFPERAAKRKLLMKDEDLWLYTPGVKRAIRIGVDQRLAGDVANGDILRTRFNEDYSAKLLGADKKSLRYELTKSSKAATYAKIIYTLQPGTFKPQKAEFFAVSGKSLKVAEFVEFKKVGGETLCTKIKITDAQSQRESTIAYSKFKPRNFTANDFNKDAVVEF